MAESKDELIAALGKARADLSRGFGKLRRDADLPAHFKHSFGEHKAAWIGGAGIAGWIISRIPARKKKVYVGTAGKVEATAAKAAEYGLLFGILKFLFTILRPAITSFATKKIGDLAAKNPPWKK